MKKKIFAFIAMIVVIVSSFSMTYAALTTIHEKVETEILTSAAVLKKYTRFTDKGFLEINVIEVDLEDGNTKVGLLNSENGLNTFQTVYQMANKDNIVAAINGDFFNGTYKNGNTIGLSISDGELRTSPYYENEVKDTFGSFVLDEENNAWFDYFTGKMILKNEKNEQELLIAEVNKLSSNYEYPVLYTSAWGEKSLGSSGDFVVTELVVANGKVKEIRYNEESVEIPEDGFVITTSGSTAETLKNEFAKGSKVSFDVEIGLDIDKINMAISGGAMLVENGEIPEKFSSNISGSNPRTAVGLSKDGKTMYLVTVDGRQKKSIGMTQTELAEFLIQKGIYNALNLDGGGSTTMVARKLGESSVKTINSPSGGVLRMVTNAIGVYNTNKTSSLSNLVIKVPEENVFVGCERKIEVLGYDKYYNPVEVDFDDIKWSVSGAEASIEEDDGSDKRNIGKIIAGNNAGTATITAKKGRVEASINVDILSAPNELEVSPKSSAISVDETIKLDVTAKNKNGYYASINSKELELEVVSGEGSFDGLTYTPSKEGEHIIKISAGNAATYAHVSVYASNKILLNDFETENFKFVSYPAGVTGDAEISRREVYDGNKSAKLTYDFTKLEATRAAYLRFDEPIEIPEDAVSVSLMVYSEKSKSDHIKMKLVDARGNVQLVTMNKTIPGGKWTNIEYDLSSVSLPATVTDIYVAQDSKDEKNEGTVYFDNFMLEKSFLGQEATEIEIPYDIKGEDALNTMSTLGKEESFKFAIYDNIKKPVTLLDQLSSKKLEQAINSEAEAVIFTSQFEDDLCKNITVPKIKCGQYSKEELENSTFITLDISNGGVRTTDFEEWISLQDDIKNDRNKNIFIVMNGALEDFTDLNERKLFIDVLCDLRRQTGKNIWVIHEGKKTTYKMERGVKYLIIGNEWLETKGELEKATGSNYILVTVSDSGMTYEVKNVFEEEKSSKSN